LMVSFVVVLVNSLILLFLKRVVQALSSSKTFPANDHKRCYLPFREILLQKRWHYFADPRAPPVST
jgi:hypothetical protein